MLQSLSLRHIIIGTLKNIVTQAILDPIEGTIGNHRFML